MIKNFGSVVKIIVENLPLADQLHNHFEKVVLTDDIKCESQEIRIDMRDLLANAIIKKLESNGVVKSINAQGDFNNGIATNLEDISIDVKNGKIYIHVSRDESTVEHFKSAMLKNH